MSFIFCFSVFLVSQQQSILLILLYLYSILSTRAYLRGGGVQGVQPPPPKCSDFFLKSEGKRWKEKEKKGCWGGGLRLGLIFFRVGLRYFRGVEKFSGGVDKFSGGVDKFSWGS